MHYDVAKLQIVSRNNLFITHATHNDVAHLSLPQWGCLV